MSAENHGTGATPEGGDEDPFAYLYRQEGGAQQPAASGQQPGVPRRSFNQVRAVGERQYGYGYPQQQQQGGGYRYPQQGSGYGYPQQPPQPAQQPSAHYAAPETVPGGRAAARQQGAGQGPGRGRRNRTGLLVGAIAVVAAVVIGIGAAIVFNKDEPEDPQAKPSGTAQQDGGQDQGGDKKDDKPDEKTAPKGLPKEDAASLTLGGSATTSTDIKGAEGQGGAYVSGLDQPGASATWELKDLPEGGRYTLHVRYGVPGQDADATLTVNGKAEGRPLRLKNFAGAKKGDWEHGWTNSWSNIQLNEGENSIKISCEDGNKCGAVLDKVWLEKGWG